MDITNDLRAELTKRREMREMYTRLYPNDPVVPDIFTQILGIVEQNPAKLNMSWWHSECNTVHCLAGWAVTLAGEKGQELERKYGTARAASDIFLRNAGHAPNFFTTDAEAMKELRLGALLEKLDKEVP